MGRHLGIMTAAAALLASPALAADNGRTDFGERLAPQATVKPLTIRPFTNAPAVLPRRGPVVGARSLGEAVALLRGRGRVTSTFRSLEHNRAVGGVPNSYHLRGRAIDLVRAAGVRHAELDAMFRAAGFHLVESLDEGDHSHFAFAWQGQSAAPLLTAAAGSATSRAQTAALPGGVSWKWVYAPSGRR